MPLTIPCGQCIGCRLERSRQWATRCLHEASLYDANCFVTLTYDEVHIPPLGGLRKRDFQLFMKRLREYYSGSRIRFFHCGEYGSTSKRPHYHCLLFGFDFPDKRPWSIRRGLPVWRSEVLEKLWPYGQSEIGSVTFESAAYVARYVVKKVTGEAAAEHYLRLDEETGELVRLEPEYCTMSRRPGIGAEWYAKFGKEVFPADSVVCRGHLSLPPRYYGDLYELADSVGARKVKVARKRRAKPEESTPERLLVREKCAIARLESLKREAV